MKQVEFQREEGGERFAAVWEILNGDYPAESEIMRAADLLQKDKTRDGEWHYVQAAVDYYKRFYYDCKKELKKAIKLDPENGRYRAALAELEEMAKSAKEAGTPLQDDKVIGCMEGCAISCCDSICRF